MAIQKLRRAVLQSLTEFHLNDWAPLPINFDPGTGAERTVDGLRKYGGELTPGRGRTGCGKRSRTSPPWNASFRASLSLVLTGFGTEREVRYRGCFSAINSAIPPLCPSHPLISPAGKAVYEALETTPLGLLFCLSLPPCSPPLFFAGRSLYHWRIMDKSSGGHAAPFSMYRLALS